MSRVWWFAQILVDGRWLGVGENGVGLVGVGAVLVVVWFGWSSLEGFLEWLCGFFWVRVVLEWWRWVGKVVMGFGGRRFS